MRPRAVLSGLAVAAFIVCSAKHSPFPAGCFCILKVLAAALRTRAGTLGTRSGAAGVAGSSGGGAVDSFYYPRRLPPAAARQLAARLAAAGLPISPV